MYFAVIRFEPFNGDCRLMGRIKVRVSADMWLVLPPTVRTMTGPETLPRTRTRDDFRKQIEQWRDPMGRGWV